MFPDYTHSLESVCHSNKNKKQKSLGLVWFLMNSLFESWQVIALMTSWSWRATVVGAKNQPTQKNENNWVRSVTPINDSCLLCLDNHKKRSKENLIYLLHLGFFIFKNQGSNWTNRSQGRQKNGATTKYQERMESSSLQRRHPRPSE